MSALRDFDIEQLRMVGATGEQGVHVSFTNVNVFTLLFVDRNHPGLLEGMSVEEDPTGKRVRLTAKGREVVEQAT